MSVQPGPTFKRYAANGVATVYAIPFLLIDAEDLLITLDGDLVTSGFALTGVGDPSSTCTFTLPPTGDLLFQLVIPFQRLFDYQENGDFLANTVNKDFDRIWQALKELRRDDSRALVASPLEPEGIPPLPVKAIRSLKMLAFDVNGNPTPSTLTLEQIEQQPALALASAAAAAQSANEAGAASTAAQGYANTAQAAQSAATASATLAQRWANEAVDVPVAGGLYSAFHWAQKTLASLAGLTARVLALENIGKPFTKDYVSTPQTFVNGGLVTVAHGLGAAPKDYKVYYQCAVAADGFSVGDVVEGSGAFFFNSSSYGSMGWADGTNINIGIGPNGVGVLHKTTRAFLTVSPTNWRIVVRAFA